MVRYRLSARRGDIIYVSIDLGSTYSAYELILTNELNPVH